jgi:hypothetical protein
MDFYEEASLVMVPSGYKDQKVYSSVPDDGSGDLTFSRASNATRVGPDGLIEKVRTNLLLQSNTFSTTWTLDVGMALTSGQSGYDGSSDAWSLSKPAANFREMSQAVSYSGVSTYSIYAKSGSLTAMTLRFVDGVANHYARFNLATGTTISTTGSIIETNVIDAGGGWWRCSAVTSGIAGISVYVYPDIEYNDTSGNILIQAAQLESGDIATDYIATTTAAVSVGPVANLPRLDYSGGATCPRLLLEPQRTNAITFSEQMDNAAWIKNVNAAVTANQAISPDGYQNADLVSNTLVGGGMDYYQLVTGSASTTYTYSVFVKAATHTKCALRAFVGATSPFTTTPAAYFDLATASVIQSYGSATNAKIEAVGSNGWYRVSMTFPTIGTSHYLNLFPLSDTYSVSASNAPLNYSSTGGVYFWGAQYEIGAYATSYINTLGAAVTRVADACSKTGISSLIGQTEGTLFVDVAAFVGANEDRQISINDGTTSNRVTMALLSNGTQIQFVVASGGTITMNSTQTISGLTTGVKIAYSYKLNDFAVYANGLLLATDTSGAVPISPSVLSFDSGASDKFFGKVNQALVFKTRLSNDDLATLTTL